MSRPPWPLRILKDLELWIYAPRMEASAVHQVYWDQYRVLTGAEDLSLALSQRFPAGAEVAVLPGAPMQELESPELQADVA